MNNNYIKFTGTVDDFLSTITHNKFGYLFKPNGYNLIKLWWEKEDDHFLNIAHGKKNVKVFGDSSWVLSHHSVGFLKQIYIADGHEMYLEK